jgi:hypothetical protein
MAFEDTDRRRTLILGLLTLLALPAIYFYTRTDLTGTLASDLVVEPAGAGAQGADEPNRPSIALTDQEPSFLDGPAQDANPGVNEIAIPSRPGDPPLELTASYRSTIPGVGSCYVQGVDPGLTVTVRNMDNARSVACVTALPPSPQVADVVLHTDAFTRLADPTEAPIMVELTR